MAVTVITVAATVYSAHVQQQSSKKASRQAAAAAAERREASAIEQAGGKNIDKVNRRKVLREERVRRAQIEQGAEGGGATGSSGALASPGIISTGVAAAIGAQTGERKAIEGVSAHRQAGADLSQAARTTLAKGSSLSKTIGAIGSVGASFAKAGLFDPSPTVKPDMGKRKPGVT